jgi:hypothetical protein
MAESHLQERDMHRDYRAAEESYRSAAARLIERELALRDRIRSRVDASEVERQEDYREGHGLIMSEYERLADAFSRQQSQAFVEAERTLYGGPKTSSYQQALTEAAAASDEKLPELMKLAASSGLGELERAVAVVANQRKPGRSELFDQWVSADPARVAARERLLGTPKPGQFYDRVRALKPPRAEVRDLEPTAADYQAAREAKAQQDAPRQRFFGGTPAPVRQVGSRIS